MQGGFGFLGTVGAFEGGESSIIERLHTEAQSVDADGF
jgi:hypothetical protein